MITEPIEYEVYETYTHIEDPEQLPVSLAETLAMLFLPLVGIAIISISVWMAVKFIGG